MGTEKSKGAEPIIEKTFKLRLPFIVNEGQIRDGNVRFYAKTFGGTVFVTEAGEIFYSLPKREEEGNALRGWVLKEELLGGRVKGVKGQEEAPTRVSYFIGNDPSQWKSNISTYGSVSFGEVYEGIEVNLRAYGRSVEKLFYVRAGVEPGVIRLRLSGAESLGVNGEGELQVRTGLGEVKFSRPVAYQEVEGERRYVEVSYQVEGKDYGFKLGDYERGRELIIDPLLQSTYLGGSGGERAYSIAIDSGGNVYVAGETDSTNFPGTTGGAQPSYGRGPNDAFVAKLNPTLTTILQSTYLGGNGYDWARSIAIDSGGNVYVAGRTYSYDFPGTAGGAQPSHGGGDSDAFVTKLNPTLTTILQSTYLGGKGWDAAWSIAIDSGGNVYVAGETFSTIDFPGTEGGAQPSGGGGGDAFVAKLNPALTTLIQSTYLGGSGYYEWANSIAIGSGGDVYVAGYTTSTNFPGTAGGAQPSDGGGSSDAFVAKLNPTLTTLVQSTYLGGSGGEEAWSIVIDSAGNVYVAGETDSTDFPGTAGGAQPSNGGGEDAFVAKLNPTLTTILQSTYLGGNTLDGAWSIAIGSGGNVFVAGDTYSTNFPSTAGGAQPSRGGMPDAFMADAFVSKLNPTLTAILQSTYLGGSDSDYAYSIAMDSGGNVYVAGWTYSNDLPGTAGGAQPSNGGGFANRDAFVSKLTPDLSAVGAPKISLSPDSLNFDKVNVGSSKDLDFIVQNTGTGTLSGTASVSTPFSIVAGSPFNLTAGQSQTVTVRFGPTFSGIFASNVTFASNGGNASPVVQGEGVSLKPRIDSLSPTLGPVWSAVIILGSNFGATQGLSTIQVCSVAAQVGHWEDSLLAMVVPSLPAGTLCPVIVTTPNGSSNSRDFTITSPNTISGFVRTLSGKGINGVKVIIDAGAKGIVKTNWKGFYSKSGLPTGQFTVKPVLSGYLFTPEEQIVTLNGVNAVNVNFTGEAVIPVISRLYPGEGNNSTKVTISGIGFGSFESSVNNKVRFGNSDASILSWSNNKIVALPPPGTGSVLVGVVTGGGISNTKPFTYKSLTPKNVRLIPSGDFKVLIFKEIREISSDSLGVVAEITIENVTGAWYVVHPGIVGGITGPNLPADDFLIGPFEERSLGRVTFPKRSRLSLLADNSIDIRSCTPICNLQTRRILGALALELFWRIITSGPFPVSEWDKILFLAGMEENNPVVSLGIDIWQGDILGIVNDLPDVLEDPLVGALLQEYGVPGELPGWLSLYGKAAEVARLLIDMLIYPNVGQLVFSTK